MLTDAQKKYLQTIPKNAIAKVKPWDTVAAKLAKNLIKKIKTSFPDLEVFWSGALALGISGQNDIDLSILSSPLDFKKYLPRLILILGKPRKKSEKNVMWRTVIKGYSVDAYLSDKNSKDVRLHKKIFKLLKTKQNLLKKYKLLKENANGLPLREYMRRKYEFYNKIIRI